MVSLITCGNIRLSFDVIYLKQVQSVRKYTPKYFYRDFPERGWLIAKFSVFDFICRSARIVYT